MYEKVIYLTNYIKLGDCTGTSRSVLQNEYDSNWFMITVNVNLFLVNATCYMWTSIRDGLKYKTVPKIHCSGEKAYKLIAS